MDTKTATFLIALFLIQSASADPRGLFAPLIQECIEKEDVTKELVNSMLNGTRNGNLTVAESNPNLKCFSACLLEKGKVLDGCKWIYLDEQPDGQPEDTSEYKVAAFCKSAVKSNERCECGYELHKCVIDYFNKIEEERQSN